MPDFYKIGGGNAEIFPLKNGQTDWQGSGPFETTFKLLALYDPWQHAFTKQLSGQDMCGYTWEWDTDGSDPRLSCKDGSTTIFSAKMNKTDADNNNRPYFWLLWTDLQSGFPRFGITCQRYEWGTGGRYLNGTADGTPSSSDHFPGTSNPANNLNMQNRTLTFYTTYTGQNVNIINTPSTIGSGGGGWANSLYSAAMYARINEDDPDPNAKWGNSTPGGGKGTRPGTSGKIVNPYAPSIDALDAGFMTAFLPTVSQLNELASYLWSNPISFESLEKMISNPFDLIIGLHMLPISIASSGTKAIKPGALVSGISAAYTDKQIVTKDFGTLAIAERWGSVLDYAPYTKISIHLPYIGTRTLDTDEVMGKTIGLKYKVDILSGACVAEISVDGSVMYEFAGNMALDIPITAQDHRQLLATLATIGVTAAGAGLAALGGAGAVAGAGAAASEAAGATGITAATVAQVGNAAVGVVMAAKPTIERAGGLGSAAGWCGVQTPYILIESPEQSLPKNYMSFNGYPCNMSFTLSELTGYTQCETVRFGSTHATDPEMQEVIASLQAGVVLGGTAPTKPTDPVAGIGVTLYQNASPALYVYKDITAYGAQHVCNFKQPTDIVNPTITLELSAIDFNYVYIGGSVDRYYYVTEKRSVRRGVWEVELKCDPLMSFANDILAASAVVSRQENDWNLYLDDGTFKAYQYTNFYQEPFATSFDTSTYVLIVAGS